MDEAENLPNPPSQLPYLEAIMTETLRLKPSVPSGNPRVTPPEGLVIDEVRIPGNTIVIIPQYVVQRDERNYVRPLEFLPERWMEEGKDLTLDGKAFFPFTIGKSIPLELRFLYAYIDEFVQRTLHLRWKATCVLADAYGSMAHRARLRYLACAR